MPSTTTRSARERLLTAATERFGAKGVANVTLEDVRERAGVSVGALYHHFADKGALLDAVYVELISGFQTAFLAELRAAHSAAEGVQGGVRCYLRWVTANRLGASILLGHRPDSPVLRERNRSFLDEVMSWWRTHVHYGAVRKLPADLLHALWLGPAQEFTRHWLAGHAKRVPASASSVLAQAAWQVLKETT